MAKRQEKLESRPPQLALVNNRLKLRLDDLLTFQPLTSVQKQFFDAYKSGSQVLLLHGVAGTGKTFVALYKALEEVMDKSSVYKKVVIVRSAVATRDIGFLPGDEKEKTEIFQEPYIEICETLFNRSDAFQRLNEQGMIKFMSTSFVRGITLEDSVVIVDECQNMSWHELNSIITRVGRNTKIMFCGDFRQTDLSRKHDLSGLERFVETAHKMHDFKILEFGIADIVRSEIVKEWIIASLEYEECHA